MILSCIYQLYVLCYILYSICYILYILDAICYVLYIHMYIYMICIHIPYQIKGDGPSTATHVSFQATLGKELQLNDK